MKFIKKNWFLLLIGVVLVFFWTNIYAFFINIYYSLPFNSSSSTSPSSASPSSSSSNSNVSSSSSSNSNVAPVSTSPPFLNPSSMIPSGGSGTQTTLGQYIPWFPSNSNLNQVNPTSLVIPNTGFGVV